MGTKFNSDADVDLDKPTIIEEECSEFIQHELPSYTLKELLSIAERTLGTAESTESQETTKVRHSLLQILAYLRCGERIREESGDQSSVVLALASIIERVIAPRVSLKPSKEGDAELPAAFDDDLKKALKQRLEHCQAVSGPGLAVLEALAKHVNANGVPLGDDDVLLTLLAFTDESQEWTSPDTATTARALLVHQFDINHNSLTKERFIGETVLRQYLRPLFSKSKPPSVTASGRKAEYPDTDSRGGHGSNIPDDSPRTKPWKYTDLRAITAAAWAVSEADDQLVAKLWPLFTPVLLTLVDDSSTPVRQLGLLILADFLTKIPNHILHNNGLGKLFEDAVFPTLAYLPSLTPTDESIQLLVPAYTVLLRLANKQPATTSHDGVRNGPKNRLLDKMLREGVFMAYFHAKEYISIVEVLCQQTALILNQMGIHAVKHLKDLIPMLSAIMADPFAPMGPATLLAAIQALQAVLANCWPRIPASPWQDEIINALVLCWLHLPSHDSEKNSAPPAATSQSLIEQELLTCSKMLAAVLKTGNIDLAEHVAPVIEKEPALAGLFPGQESPSPPPSAV